MILAKFLHNLEYDEHLNEDFEDDWKTSSWWKNKCSLLKARDKHSAINLEREEGVLVHSFDIDSLKLLRLVEVDEHCERQDSRQVQRVQRLQRRLLPQRAFHFNPEKVPQTRAAT